MKFLTHFLEIYYIKKWWNIRKKFFFLPKFLVDRHLICYVLQDLTFVLIKTYQIYFYKAPLQLFLSVVV